MKRIFIPTTLFFLLFSFYAEAVPYPYHPSKTVDITSSNLPIAVINLDEQLKPREQDERTNAVITILSRKDGLRNNMNDLSGTPDFSDRNIFDFHGKIGIKYRGSTSFNLSDKKPFLVRTIDDDGSKKDIDILGMGAHYDWVFLAPFADRAMMRDVLTFELQQEYFEFTPRARYCELVLEGVYQGVYIVVARTRRGKSRIDIPKPGLSGDALTGGYHLDIDRENNDGFYSKHQNKTKDWVDMPYSTSKPYRTYFRSKYPDPEDYAPEQLEYIQNFIDEVEYTFLGDNFDHPTQGFRYYIDELSAIDYILTQEYTYNIDGYRLSTPIYKYNNAKDPRLKFSIWDFNITMGNVNYLDGQYFDGGWLYQELNDRVLNEGHSYSVPFWFPRMMEDYSFELELRQRWCQYRSTTHSDEQIFHKIDSLTNLLNEAQERNFTAWNNLSSAWPDAYTRGSWEEHIEYMTDFLLNRIAWMDEQFEIRAVQTITGGSAMPSVACTGIKVTIKPNPAPDGDVFFCWKGADAHLLDDIYSPTATFTMPGRNIEIYAFYAPISFDGVSMQKRQVSPNPAGDHIKIDGVENASYTIINHIGKPLISGTGYNGEAIDISQLQPGGYVIRIDGVSLFFVKR